ncbi:MAG: DUF5723 family protein [Bacteroidota bacterium]
MRFTVITILAFLIVRLEAQNSVSFFHLGNTTFQNTYLNPSLIPEGKTFIGLPLLSGIHVHFNSKLSYNEVFTKENDEILVDVYGKILPNLQRNNLFSAHVNVNLFHLGIKTKKGMLIGFMANERVEADAVYSRDLVDFFWNGNDQFLNRDIKPSDAGIKGTHFREIGLSLAAPINERLTLGAKGKFLVGFLDISTPGNFNARLNSSGEAFQVDAEWKNYAIRTSGFDIYDGNEGSLSSHLVMNSNNGLALDLGATYRLHRNYTITGSILDIGYIRWKEDIYTEALNDTTFRYDGVQLDNLGTIVQTVQDSLLDRFVTTENNDPYTSWLPVKVYGSWIYHYSQKTDIHLTTGSRIIQRQAKMLYGLGIIHRFGKVFTASVSATKLPQQFINLGAAFALKGGPIQMYLAADQMVNYSVPDMRLFDFRFGINFIFEKKDAKGNGRGGYYNKPFKARAKGYDTNIFLGKKVKTKKREGIYSIIKRQKRRELKDKKTKQRKISNKSLNGFQGKKNLNNELH